MPELAIDWTLDSLFSSPWYVLPTVSTWMKPEFMHKFYKGRYSGTRFHPGQIDKFTRQDKRAGTKWRSHLAKILFATRRAVIEYAKKHHSQNYDLWMLRNCQPSGGVWTGNRFYTGPTGKRCQHPLCPWCYLRRFHDYRKICLAEKDAEVNLVHRAGKTRGLGLGNKVNLTVIEARGNESLLTRFSQWEFRKRAQEAVVRPYAGPEGAVDRRRLPEFDRALRLFSIAFEEDHFVLRMGHVHVRPTPSPRLLMGKAEGLCQDFCVMRHEGIMLDEALRTTNPFPINLLSGVSEGRQIVRALFKRRTYSLVRLKNPASQKASPSRSQQPSATDRYEADCLSIGTSAT